MMMDTAVQQPTDANGQPIVTPAERQVVLQRLTVRWKSDDLASKVEREAFDKSNGSKQIYIQYINKYYQHVQNHLANRGNPQQPMNNNLAFSNPQPNLNQPSTMPINNQITQQMNTIPRFPMNQTATRMINPSINNPNSMTRLREPQKLQSTAMPNLSFGQPQSSTPPTATIDFSSNCQPRFTLQQPINIPRQRLPTQAHFQAQPSAAVTVNATSANPNDVLHQFITGNPTGNVQPVSTIANPPAGPSGDQLLQRILSSNVADANANKTRALAPNIITQPSRQINPPTATANVPIRASLSPSPSVNQTSTVQIQPSSNITIQQSPLSNSNGPHSASSQSTSYSSPLNRNATLSANGNLSSPEDELQNLVKYLKENVHRLQLLVQKFTNENNHEKLRQVQMIQQQIAQFIHNPTYEAVANAKNFRDVLERISNRTAQANPPPAAPTAAVTAAAAPPPPPLAATNSFTQCLKATHDFLSREPKERLNVSKRYLEPLADVINGVPHKIMRLDNDSYPIIKVRCTTNNSLLTTIADEINQLPKDIFSIERISDYRTRKSFDNHQQNGIILRCKLLDKANPILPPVRLHVPTTYPEQAPEIVSLTKTPSPKLDFSDGHPLFERISSIFVSHLFKLRPQHTITEILNIWRQSVQTAL